MLLSRITVALLWLLLIAIVWLTVASCVFLWLAGLWDSPLIPSWSRPWQWWVYLRRGDGSFSEGAYLIASALVASMPIVASARFIWLSSIGCILRPSLYGMMKFASPDKMRRNGFRLTKDRF